MLLAAKGRVEAGKKRPKGRGVRLRELKLDLESP